MERVNVSKSLDNQRKAVSAKVRELRLGRGWTQRELASHLDLSQSRLSEIENGSGSFTAEQFLRILELFNVTASHFVGAETDHGAAIQNALARLGAVHLRESSSVFPSDDLDDVARVIREVLVNGESRFVTALAPVLVKNFRINLMHLHAELATIGRERRLAWLVDNTRSALGRLQARGGSIGKEWNRIARRVLPAFELYLEGVSGDPDDINRFAFPIDVLDPAIRTKQTRSDVFTRGSTLSIRWCIVTSLKPEDFVEALEAARVADR
jgi:transcriptional regulator with XRE-family HTH domain